MIATIFAALWYYHWVTLENLSKNKKKNTQGLPEDWDVLVVGEHERIISARGGVMMLIIMMILVDFVMFNIHILNTKYDTNFVRSL